MIILAALFVSLFVFRALGFAGVAALSSWHVCARDAMGVMLLFTAAAHFTAMKEDLIRMIPSWIPSPRAIVYFTGICEIAGALGLFVPQLNRAAGAALVLFFLAILPANIQAVKAGITLRGKPPTDLILRIPMQLLFIAWVWWSVRL
ncbi:MAG TPA: DoxX family protein [Candidatus Acidoferrum sp.]|jgi:uncharacterized membrane protein|nr:DoxX family protein [Candidatus Acidoferrum sp.]